MQNSMLGSNQTLPACLNFLQTSAHRPCRPRGGRNRWCRGRLCKQVQLVVKVEGQVLACMGSRFLAAAVSRRRLFTSCRLAAEIARNWPSLANPAQPHPAHQSERHPNPFHLLVCSPSLPKEANPLFSCHILLKHADMGTTERCVMAD